MTKSVLTKYEAIQGKECFSDASETKPRMLDMDEAGKKIYQNLENQKMKRQGKVAKSVKGISDIKAAQLESIITPKLEQPF